MERRRRSSRLTSKPTCNTCNDQELSATPTRCSKRLLEAQGLQSKPTDISHITSLPTIEEEVAKNIQTVNQVSNFPRDTLLTYSTRTRKTGASCSEKRGRFIEENINSSGKLTANLIKQEFHAEHHQSADPPAEPHRLSTVNQALSGDCLALTEIAAMARKSPSNDSDDEIASSFNPAFVTVGNYRVKEEYASLVRNIFNKYGDIAKDCTFKSATSCSLFLEMVCVIIQRLQGCTILEITHVDLNSMINELADLKFFGLDVEWLSKKVNQIYEAKTKISESSSIKEEMAKSEEAIEKMAMKITLDEMVLTTKQDEVEILQGKLGKLLWDIGILKDNISSSKENLAVLKSRDEEIKASGHDARKKVSSVFNKSLVDGLL